jgi:nicotinamidase/pyrazinamidase
MRVSLLVIDIQKDFCEGGILAARNTGSLLGPLNRAVLAASSARIPVVFTRDWHPIDHGSFVGQGGPWPPHCVQNSEGAEFAPGLTIPKNSLILNKGVAQGDDGYSMFVGTPLLEWLRRDNIESVAVCGIATEYCVLESVKDGLRNQFKVYLLEDLIRPIERDVGDSDKALAEMQLLGAIIMKSTDWVKNVAPSR